MCHQTQTLVRRYVPKICGCCADKGSSAQSTSVSSEIIRTFVQWFLNRTCRFRFRHSTCSRAWLLVPSFSRRLSSFIAPAMRCGIFLVSVHPHHRSFHSIPMRSGLSLIVAESLGKGTRRFVLTTSSCSSAYRVVPWCCFQSGIYERLACGC